jgi:hypothetical protein
MQIFRAFAATCLAPALLAGCGNASGSTASLPAGHLAYVDASGRLALTASNGLGTIEITPANSTTIDPAITRDGKMIAFGFDPSQAQSTTLGLYVISTTTGSVAQQLVPALSGQQYHSPVWDRESANIFFVSSNAGVTGIAKVAVTGGASTPVGPTLSGIQFVALVDDQTLLVMASGNTLNLLNVASGSFEPIGSIITSARPAVSNDGAAIAYLNGTGAIVIRQIASGVESQVNLGTTVPQHNLWFSPDDTFVSFDDGAKIYAAPIAAAGTKQALFAGTDASWGT